VHDRVVVVGRKESVGRFCYNDDLDRSCEGSKRRVSQADVPRVYVFTVV